MKKLIIFMLLLATLSLFSLHAQKSGSNKDKLVTYYAGNMVVHRWFCVESTVHLLPSGLLEFDEKSTNKHVVLSGQWVMEDN